MNYHNFASRLSIRRLPPAQNARPEPPKPAPKKVSREARRRLATAAAALTLLAFLSLPAQAGTPAENARAANATHRSVNMPTFLITITGLAVAFLRLPTLWRRDFDC